MNYKLVSIVTPVYNQRNYIELTINSVLEQTYPNIEYIVVNDGSTDGTDVIVDKYSDLIKVFHTENKGQAEALNFGWSQCTGEYISYLSGDDILDQYCIEKLVDVLNNKRDTVCVYPDCDLISAEGKILKRSVCKPFVFEDLLVKQECHIGPGALWRADNHNKVGGWKKSLKLAPDREFWMRLSTTGSIEFIDTTLAYYRLHTQSISYAEVSEDTSIEYLAVLDDFFSNQKNDAFFSSLREKSYAYANLLIARNMLRDGRYRRALHYIYNAWQLDRESVNLSNLFLLGRSAVGKPMRILMSKMKLR